MTIKRNIVLLISLLSLGVGMALAQIESSTITGTVTDQKGAVVASANITITEVNTGVNTTVKSNGVGEYTAPYLTQGLYTVTVQAPAFETYKKTGIPLASKTVVRIDVQLTVGSVSQTVEVTASTAELQTETTTVQGTVDANVIMNIPNINDNPLYYATLQAGVVPSSEMYNNEALGVGYSDRQKMSGMNINGGEAGNNDVQIDGLSVQGAAWHESSQLPNRDALQEVAVTTNALSADLGGGLGVIQMSTKSGTNQFHGDLAYRMRNEAFNANGTSNDVQGIPKGKYRLNEESGAVGGPIRIPYIFDGRDKVFFFTSYSRDSHPSTESGFDTVPTALQRTGDFSASTMRDQNGNPIPSQMYNPWTAIPVAGSNGQTYSRTEYPQGPNSSSYGTGDMVNTPNAAGLVMLSQYPLPNHAPLNAFQDNNFEWSGAEGVVRDNLSARIDVHILPKNSIYVSGGLQTGTSTFANQWADGVPAQSGYTPAICCGAWGVAYTDENYFGSIGDTITVSPTTVVDVRYGINRVHATAADPRTGAAFTASTYETWGMPASVQAYIAVPGAVPTIGNTGGDLGVENWDDWENKNEHQTNHSLAASVTKLLGKWTLKEGAEYRVYLGNWQDLVTGTPAINMGCCGWEPDGGGNLEAYGSINGGGSSLDNTPQLSGDSTASLPVGAEGWFLQSGATSKPALAAKYLAFYTQNDWKATPRLTVNLGLRYEVQPGPTERHNQAGSLDLNAANPYAAMGINSANADSKAGLGFFAFPGQSGYSRNLWDTQWNNFGPRIGAAYQLGNSSVLRAGYGRIFAPSNTGFNANTTIYGTAGFAGGVSPIPYGTGTGTGYNGLPAGTGLEDPAMTQVHPSAGAVQAPGVYGGFGDPGLFIRNFKNAYTDEWNLTLERRFRGWIASTGYIGSKSTHLQWRDQAINGQFDIPWTTLQGWQSEWQATNGTTDPAQVQVPNPLPGLIGGAAGNIGSGTISVENSMMPYLAWLGGDMVGDTGSSLYHSLQFKAQHSYTNGLEALFTYTYSRTTQLQAGQNYPESQLGSSTTQNGGTDYRNLSNNRNLSDFDTPNRFVGVVSYLLPTGKGQRFDPGNPVARAVIGEWNLATVVTLQSGQPWGPYCGSENGRCFLSGQALKLPKSFQKWYDGNTQVTLPDGRMFTPSSNSKLIWNPDAFTGQIVQWADGTYRQAQYWEGVTKMIMGELRMPALQNVNLSVSRKFPIREGMSFEILAEATNAFNHTNYTPNNVSNDYSNLVTIADPSHDSTVGENQSTSTGTVGLNFLDARQMTLSARFDF